MVGALNGERRDRELRTGRERDVQAGDNGIVFRSEARARVLAHLQKFLSRSFKLRLTLPSLREELATFNHTRRV